MSTAKFQGTPGPWVIRTSSQPGSPENHAVCSPSVSLVIANVAYGNHSHADVKLIAAAPDLLEALEFVKAWFAKLEDGLGEDDPVTKLRRKFHAPVHEAIDSAISKALGHSGEPGVRG